MGNIVGGQKKRFLNCKRTGFPIHQKPMPFPDLKVGEEKTGLHPLFLPRMVLQGRQLAKKYGQIQVLKSVDIAIEKGELVTIVGPSGAGKSTLLQILGTLDRADSGTLEILSQNPMGLSVKNLAAFRNRYIGFVFQFHHLMPEFTALENVCMPGWIAGKDDKEVKNKAISLLERLGLGERLHHKPTELSGGEQQRASIARALMNDPAIVMADEPTGNLDSQNAESLHRIFLELKKELNQTFIMVTHNMDLAGMADRVLEMKDGFLTEKSSLL
jgi:lipoprotein-releasing system ATP-binding protein